MATSSITKNFVISGKEQVDIFIKALEESEKDRPIRTKVNAIELTDIEDIIKFMEKRKMVHAE